MTGALSRRLAATLAVVAAVGGCRSWKPRVVFVTGDDEYRSEITMPMLARILEREGGAACQVLYAVNPETGARDPKDHRRIEGLEALAGAQLAVFFLRYRELPDAELDAIVRYTGGAHPVLGLRTSTHAFQYKTGPDAKWNDEFGLGLFGQKWLAHAGHDTTTRVSLSDRDHPAVRGVKSTFDCASWLYTVEPLPADCRILAYGEPVKGGSIVGPRQPVAWTRDVKGRRVFYTSLGHPADFDLASVRRLVVQGAIWCLGYEDEIPDDGLAAELPKGYSTPSTH
jgi:hypothetical protein